jgi:hypothetical protein
MAGFAEIIALNEQSHPPPCHPRPGTGATSSAWGKIKKAVIEGDDSLLALIFNRYDFLVRKGEED